MGERQREGEERLMAKNRNQFQRRNGNIGRPERRSKREQNRGVTGEVKSRNFILIVMLLKATYCIVTRFTL